MNFNSASIARSADDQETIKTLIVDLSLKYGGSTSRVISLLSRYPKGYISVAGLKGSAIIQEAKKRGLAFQTIGNHKADPRIVMRLIRLIRKHDIKVVDAQNIQSKFYASLAATLTNTALISTIHSWYKNEHGKTSVKGNVYTTLELATNWNLSLYITVSEKDRLALLRSGIKPSNIELIYNAVDIAEDSFLKTPARGWLQKRLRLPENSLVCSSVGRLVSIKGYDVLINAAKLACRRIPNLVWVIIGEGNVKKNLENQIRAEGLNERVILAGQFEREDVLSAVKSSTLFVMPSRYEGTPIALLEAALVGCPILASAVGGIPELVTDGEHALLVPPDDPEALANGAVSLCNDRELAKRLALNAQQRVRQEFNVEAQISATIRAYQKARAIHNSER